MVGDQRGLSYAAFLRLGVGRLTAELVSTSDPPSGRDRPRAAERVRAAEARLPVLGEVRELKPRMLVGSSGTFSDLALMAVALSGGGEPETMNQLSVGRPELDVVERAIFSSTLDERAKLPGVDQKRTELLPAGITVLIHLMEESGLSELTISDWALREGIVLSVIGSHDRAELADDPRALRRASVLSLCRRSSWRQPHARKVAALALSLFDVNRSDARTLAGRPRAARVLRAAARHRRTRQPGRPRPPHGIPHRARRSARLRPRGGTDARSHRPLPRKRGTPRASSVGYSELSTEDSPMGARAPRGTAAHRRRPRRLALRRHLDPRPRGRVGEEPRQRGARRDHRATCSGKRRGAARAWTFRRKRELFEKTFGRRLELVVDRVGREDYEGEELVPGYS